MPIKLGPLPPRDAIESLKTRGVELSPTFDWQEAYGNDHAAMFTVAKSAGFDVLEDIYSGLQTALAEGKTYKQFAADLTPLLQSKGWWGRKEVIDPKTGVPRTVELGSPRRLKLIFDANMRVSYAAGQWANFERNRSARPFLRYVHLEGQEHPRLKHESWHNIVLPIDHSFWNTHACPNGWNCHCTLQSVSQRDIDRMLSDGLKLKFEAPPLQRRKWVNKVTGEVKMIPEGIDPGWSQNPGKAGWQETLKRLADKPDPLGVRKP